MKMMYIKVFNIQQLGSMTAVLITCV